MASSCARPRSSAWRGGAASAELAPPPVVRPQVGRVTRSATRQSCTARYCGNSANGDSALPARPAEEVEQRERHASTSSTAASVSSLRAGPTLRCTAASLARSTRGGRQADQLEGAHALVQLGARACAARPGRRASTSEPLTPRPPQEAAQRLVRRVERAAQFVVHPGRRRSDRRGAAAARPLIVGVLSIGVSASAIGRGRDWTIRRS